MKSIVNSGDTNKIRILNHSGKPNIALIFPITREVKTSFTIWRKVIEFFEKSTMQALIVVDKTESKSATTFFLQNFDNADKDVYVLPRSITETLFDSIGEIELDDNMWITQVHDDDTWLGKICLPRVVSSDTVYCFDFFCESKAEQIREIGDFSLPNRIVFSLVPWTAWNRFSNFIESQGFKVAGSADFVLNEMCQLAFRFEHLGGYSYYWKDSHWSSRRKARNHLIRLTKADGWAGWSIPDMAIFNRNVDSLSALFFIQDLVPEDEREGLVVKKLQAFVPSAQKRIKYSLLIPTMRTIHRLQDFVRKVKFVDSSIKGMSEERLEAMLFIRQTWGIKSIGDLITMIEVLEKKNDFAGLFQRFKSWKSSICKIMER